MNKIKYDCECDKYSCINVLQSKVRQDKERNFTQIIAEPISQCRDKINNLTKNNGAKKGTR